MGHQIVHLRNRLTLALFIVMVIVGVTALTHSLLNSSFYFDVFHFVPRSEQPITVDVPKVTVDPSQLDANVQAKAVPVIFYHGVLLDLEADGVNTTRSKFLSQMVALKQHGYYTINTQDLADFYSGKKKLYGKPILISFDDGRVDSYVPTDDILKKLGFQAVFFIVSGKQDNHSDPFFLTWKQLAVLNQSGRWDLQAHGWYSHTKIPIDAKGDTSNPLTNREWLAKDNRLETAAEATARITNDYVTNIKDLKTHFPGHKIDAFAVPYGDYGQKQNNFVNFTSAKQINYNICKTYFKMCFDIDNQGYNFQSHDPLTTERIEISPSWEGNDLISQLNTNRPASPSYKVDFTGAQPTIPVQHQLLGDAASTAAGLRLSSQSGVDYMNYNLDSRNSIDYRINAEYQMQEGTSVYLSGYKYNDGFHSQDVLFGMTGNVAYLNIIKDGVTTTLASQPVANFNPLAPHTLEMSLHNRQVAGSVDGQPLFNLSLPVFETHGTYGFDNYGPGGTVVTYKSLTLSPTGP